MQPKSFEAEAPFCSPFVRLVGNKQGVQLKINLLLKAAYSSDKAIVYFELSSL